MGPRAPPVVHAHHEGIEMTMTFLDGKVVIITGAGRGLGLGAAYAMAAAAVPPTGGSA